MVLHVLSYAAMLLFCQKCSCRKVLIRGRFIDSVLMFSFFRRPAIKLLTHLLTNQPRKMQEIILASRMGVSRLMDVLVRNATQ